ncbi:MAG: hypothetical protein ACTSUE_10060 [Promethearchaeota archaeon]
MDNHPHTAAVSRFTMKAKEISRATSSNRVDSSRERGHDGDEVIDEFLMH